MQTRQDVTAAASRGFWARNKVLTIALVVCAPFVMCIGMVFLVRLALGIEQRAQEAKALKSDPVRPVQAEPPKPSQPEFEVLAETLALDFERNEIAAEQKYVGRTVRIRGRVRDIGRDVLGDAYVTLGTNDQVRKVQCFFGKAKEAQLGQLAAGRSVALDGRVVKLFVNVQVAECRVAEAEQRSSEADL